MWDVSPIIQDKVSLCMTRSYWLTLQHNTRPTKDRFCDYTFTRLWPCIVPCSYSRYKYIQSLFSYDLNNQCIAVTHYWLCRVFMHGVDGHQTSPPSFEVSLCHSSIWSSQISIINHDKCASLCIFHYTMHFIILLTDVLK